MAVSEFARCVISAFLVIYFPQWGIISFAIGQVSTWEREREREREREDLICNTNEQHIYQNKDGCFYELLRVFKDTCI